MKNLARSIVFTVSDTDVASMNRVIHAFADSYGRSVEAEYIVVAFFESRSCVYVICSAVVLLESCNIV